MFSRQTDGSKIAIVALAAQLARWRFPLIDCQMPTAHLATLGAKAIPRRSFVRFVERLVNAPPIPSPWRTDDDLIAELQ
jgi:leucyl/phenylalanyl-tRNA--protein transferase